MKNARTAFFVFLLGLCLLACNDSGSGSSGDSEDGASLPGSTTSSDDESSEEVTSPPSPEPEAEPSRSDVSPMTSTNDVAPQTAVNPPSEQLPQSQQLPPSPNLPDTPSLPGTGGPFAPGINCDLAGNWSGIFYNDVSGESEAITATVTRNGLDVIIRTSKLRPPGQFFTGQANGQCGLSMVDAFDGEDWTTKFGGADGNQIRIADFLIEERDPDTGRDPLNIIELRR